MPAKDKGNASESSKHLLKQSLLASRERSLYCENTFVTWAKKLCAYIDSLSPHSKGQSRTELVKALQKNDPGFAYNGQVGNYYMVHAAEVVSEVVVNEALLVLQDLGRRYGVDFLACQYSKLWYMASAAKRWATDTFTPVDVLAFVLLLMGDDLASERLKGTKSVTKSAVKVQACSTCEDSGLEMQDVFLVCIFDLRCQT